MSAIDQPKPAMALIFGPSERRCFGWFHAPLEGMTRNTGVVLCRPLGYEGTCAYETVTRLAEYLAAVGFAVLRFDYHGTGDSTGSDADEGRVEAWLGSVQAAIEEVMLLGRV